MSTDLDHRIHEARTAKAARLAGHLTTLGPTGAARLTPQGRRQAERAAGVRVASDTTWRAALDMLTAATGAVCPTCGMGDPDGTPGPPKPYGHPGPCAT